MLNNLLSGALSLFSVFAHPTIQVIQHPLAVPVSAFNMPIPAPTSPAIESLQDKSNRIAIEHGIPTSTLSNLITSESQWDTHIEKNGDRGLAQISRKYWPNITDEQAFDPDFALNFAAEQISKGNSYKWTVCSCVQFARAVGIKLPQPVGGLNADDLFPNTEVPAVGGVIILKYPDGVHHLAPILKNTIQSDGYHVTTANKEPCKIISEIIPLNSKLIMGFYKDQVKDYEN